MIAKVTPSGGDGYRAYIRELAASRGNPNLRAGEGEPWVWDMGGWAWAYQHCTVTALISFERQLEAMPDR